MIKRNSALKWYLFYYITEILTYYLILHDTTHNTNIYKTVLDLNLLLHTSNNNNTSILCLLDQPPPEERPKHVVLDPSLPSTPKDWARFVCPDQARQIFRTNSNPHCINTHSITKQVRLHMSPWHSSQCQNHLLSLVLSLISVLFSTQQRFCPLAV